MPSNYDFVIRGQDQSGDAWRSLSKQAREAEGLLSKLADPTQELADVAKGAENLFKGFIGFEAIRRFTEFHKSVQESVGALKSQADAVGYSTDALQAYQAAFRSANLNIEGGQSAIANLNVAIGRAAMGEKEAAEAFQALGVRIFDQNGKVRENTSILTEASRALLAIEDTATRAALAKVLFSKAGAQLTPVLRETARGLVELDGAARDAGLTVSRETIEIFDRLKNKSDETAIRVRNLYAELAAPVHLQAVSALDRAFANIATNIKAAGADWRVLATMLASPMSIPTMLGGMAMTTAEKQLQDRIDAKRQEIGGLQRSLDAGDLGARGQAVQRKRLAEAQAALSELERQQQQVEAQSGKVAGRSGLQDNAPDLNLPNPANKFAQAKPTGSNRDRIGEEFEQLKGNVDAARAAYEQLAAAAATAVSLEDLQRQVELQKRISDELARIGKYAKDDPRVPQIKALVTEHERYEYQIKQLEQALKVADQTEKAYGDGTAELARRQFDLNQALATGRLSQDAFNAAMIEAGRVQQDAALKTYQYKEGLDAVIAGIEYARIQQQRQNSSFNQGIQLYNEGRQAFSGFINDVNNGLRQGQTVWDAFGNAGLSALNKIADKLLSMATDQLWSAAFPGGGGGGGGGLFGGIGGWLGSIFGGGSSAGAAGIGSTIPDFIAAGGFAFADGGRPPLGVPSVVGEEGPELFWPDEAGTVVSNRALRGLGGKLEVAISLDNALLRAVIRDESGNVVAEATPTIVGGAVTRANETAPAAIAKHQANTGGEWR